MFDHPCHQNDQQRSLVVDLILKNQIFHWYLVLFLLEAVEASLCYFFDNWLMKLKCPNLRNTQIPSFWPKSCFYMASEVFKVYQIRSKDPVVFAEVQYWRTNPGFSRQTLKLRMTCSLALASFATMLWSLHLSGTQLEILLPFKNLNY